MAIKISRRKLLAGAVTAGLAPGSIPITTAQMVHPAVAFRMTEFTNLVFDLLQDQIGYLHAKDFVWNGMMAGLNWSMNATGNMDYETFLVRISRLKRPTNVLVEFLTTEEEYAQAQRNIRAVSQKVGVKVL